MVLRVGGKTWRNRLELLRWQESRKLGRQGRDISPAACHWRKQHSTLPWKIKFCAFFFQQLLWTFISCNLSSCCTSYCIFKLYWEQDKILEGKLQTKGLGIRDVSPQVGILIRVDALFMSYYCKASACIFLGFQLVFTKVRIDDGRLKL